MNNKKILIFAFTAIFGFVDLDAQQSIMNYYYYEGQPIYLLVSTDAIVVKFDKKASKTKQEAALNAVLFSNIRTADSTTIEGIYFVRLKQKLTELEIAAKIENLNKHIEVQLAAPVLKPYRGSRVSQLVTDELIVKFAEGISKEQIFQINAKEVTEIVKELNNNTYVLRVKFSTKRNGLETANRYVEKYRNEVVYAEPNFIYIGLQEGTVDDPLHSNQWAHKNTGQLQDTDGGQGSYGFPTSVSGFTDADMDIDQAWNISTGSGILVGIIDTGVDLDHPDLEANIYNNGWDAAESDYIANDDDDLGKGGHGTACSGIVAAVGNNSIGVAGIAYNAQILPIRIFGDNGASASSSAIGSAIDTAWIWGADVLSNSWGGGTPSSFITDAIGRAKTQGRGGKGCVILFASGNDDFHTGPEYPAYLSDVIAVGATNMFDEKKSPGSRDGQFLWGGNYGSGLDISAPTITYTTDIGGSDGYVQGDYYSKFNGTSAATPNAAGVAALVLAVNPNLTSDQVQEILEKTADKVDLYSYNTIGANGDYNMRIGYGRVNAHAAVREAQGSDYTPPSIVFTPIVSTISTIDKVLSATITDASGIGTGANQPVLYYRTDTGSGFGSWIAVNDSDGPTGNVYDFTIPKQQINTHIKYYVAAKDASPQGNTGSFPFGASDNTGVGDIPPHRLFQYWVGYTDTKTFSSADVPVTISSTQINTVTSNLTVDSSFTILDVYVTIDISHTYVSNLRILLTSPSGTSVCLASDLGGSGDNFSVTVLDDEATSLIIDGSAPFNGIYQPEYPLSIFDGENTYGIWQLTIFDHDSLVGGGALNSWSLTFSKQEPDFLGFLHIQSSANPTAIYADGTSTSTISAVVKDSSGNTVTDPRFEVTFTVISGGLSAHLEGTNPDSTVNGVTEITLRADTTPGIVKIEASAEGVVPDTVTVYVISDTSTIIISDPFMVDTSSTSQQNNPKVAFDGTNYLIVWWDNYNVYGTRMSSAGDILDTLPLQLNTASGGYVPDIVYGGNYYLVAWTGQNLPARYVRVLPTGVVVDSLEKSLSVKDPSVSYSGNTYIAVTRDWDPSPSPGDSRISSITIDESGNSGQIYYLYLNNNNANPSDIIFNGNHYQLVWYNSSWGNGWGDWNIFTARINIFGNFLDSAIPVNTSSGDQLYPSIATDGEGFLVVWEDRSNPTDYNIYGSRISANGEVIDDPPIVISENTFNQQNPSIAFDGTNYWVLWEDNRDLSGNNLYGTRVTTTGVVLDPMGVKLVDRNGSCNNPHIIKGSGEQLLVVYRSYEPPPYDTFRIFASIIGGTTSIKLSDASGAPGTSTSWSTAILNSPEPIATVQFTMKFDSLISLDSVALVDQFSQMDFGYNIFTDSVRILIYSASGSTIQPENEPVVYFYYTVSQSAPFGEIFPLTLSNVVMADANVTPIPTSLRNGNFYITSKGDINFDGVVNALDLQRCINIILGRPPSPNPAELLTADVAPLPDGDGSVNVLDVTAIANIILGRSEGSLIASRSITNIDSNTILTVENGFGTPGSTNNPVEIRLNNDLSVSGLQFTLFFEDSLLTIDSVSLSPRSYNMGYDYESWSDSLKILIYSGSGESILPDTGSVVTIFLSVTENANPDESTPLMIGGIVVGDPNANPISTTGEDGVFYFNTVPSTATVSLSTNWNLISWDLDTENDSLETLLSNIMENIVVVLGFENGGLTYDPNWPQSSNLQYVDHLHGYWIKMTDVNTLNVTGWPVPDNTPISMEEGWNLVSYLPDNSDSVAHALASIIDSVVRVLGFNDGGLTYDPNWPQFSNLKILSPGFGYWIKMSGPGTLVYPLTQVAKRGFMTKGSTHISPGSGIIPTNEWVSIFGYDVIFDDKPLKVGTVIQIKDPDRVVCGEYVVDKEGRFGMMPIYRDDPASEFDEGAEPGDEMRIYVDGIEADERITWGGFGEVYRVGLMPMKPALPMRYALSQNYPNPFNPITRIDYQLPEDSYVTLSIFNILGQNVRTLVKVQIEAGSYSAYWDGKNDMGEEVTSGVYFCRMKAHRFVNTRKMVILR